MINLNKTISPDVIKVWRVSSFIGYSISMTCAFIFILLHGLYDWSYWIRIIGYIVIMLLVLGMIIETTILPKYRQRFWRYGVNEKFIYMKFGGFLFKSELIIPISKVQYVDLRQGPLLKKYELLSINIMTVSSEHEIPGLPKKVAEDMREEIAISSSLHRNEVNEAEYLQKGR